MPNFVKRPTPWLTFDKFQDAFPQEHPPAISFRSSVEAVPRRLYKPVNRFFIPFFLSYELSFCPFNVNNWEVNRLFPEFVWL